MTITADLDVLLLAASGIGFFVGLAAGVAVMAILDLNP